MSLRIASRKETKVDRYESILSIGVKTNTKGLIEKLDELGITEAGVLNIPVKLISSDMNLSITLIESILNAGSEREMGWVEWRSVTETETYLKWLKGACRVYTVTPEAIAFILAVTLLKEVYLTESEIDFLINELI